MAGSEIHTIVTYDPETHFDVNNNKIRTIGLAGSFEVITFETQNWKQNFLVCLLQLKNHAFG